MAIIFMKYIKTALKLLPHLSIIFSVMFLTFAVIDTQNRAMGFLDNSISRALIIIWAAVSIVTECVLIGYQRAEVFKELREADKQPSTGEGDEAADARRAVAALTDFVYKHTSGKDEHGQSGR